MGGIRNIGHQVKREDTTPLVNDLEIQGIFKDEDREEGSSITALVLHVC